MKRDKKQEKIAAAITRLYEAQNAHEAERNTHSSVLLDRAWHRFNRVVRKHTAVEARTVFFQVFPGYGTPEYPAFDRYAKILHEHIDALAEQEMAGRLTNVELFAQIMDADERRHDGYCVDRWHQVLRRQAAQDELAIRDNELHNVPSQL